MCGIAGFVGEGNRDNLVRMTARVSHRGPGRRRILDRGPAFFGRRRL
jgi:asparagine synthetase B (glutamine-hydrolysing)